MDFACGGKAWQELLLSALLTPNSQVTPTAGGLNGARRAAQHPEKQDGCCMAGRAELPLYQPHFEGEEIPFYGAAVPPGSQPCCGLARVSQHLDPELSLLPPAWLALGKDTMPHHPQDLQGGSMSQALGQRPGIPRGH